MLGSLPLAAAVGATLIPSLTAIAASLVLMCAGFFSIHAAAIGLLNQRLTSSRGRANSLYVLSYYLAAPQALRFADTHIPATAGTARSRSALACHY